MGFFSSLFGGAKDEYAQYSYRWLNKASEEELDEEREKIRLKHCSGDERPGGIWT